MASKIKVDQIQTGDGTGTIALQNQLSGMTGASMPTGSVLQVVSATKTDAFGTTSSSFVDTGITASITPTSSSSKIYVTVQSSFSNAEGYVGFVKLLRGSTDINIGDAYSSANRCAVGSRGMHANETVPYTINYVDSPSTTSATTYKVQVKSEGGTVAVNYSNANYTGSNNGYRTASNIILMEIQG